MKRIFNILCVLALLWCVMPVRVWAEEKTGTFSTAFGTIDYEIKNEDTATKSKTWVYYITPNDNYKSLQIQLTPHNLTNLNPTAAASFLLADKQEDSSGVVSVSLIVVSPNGLEKGVKTELMTVTTNYTSIENCSLGFSAGSISCQKIGSLYIDNNGASVTEEEFNKACGAPAEPDKPNDIPNSQTGSVTPYIAVAGGMIAIVGVYLYSRKSNKIYKI